MKIIRLRKFILTLIKIFYYMIPKFLRDQYYDSIHFYINLIKKIKNKITQKFSKVIENSIEVKESRKIILFLEIINDIKKLNTHFNILTCPFY